jgi:hypothetical protein
VPWDPVKTVVDESLDDCFRADAVSRMTAAVADQRSIWALALVDSVLPLVVGEAIDMEFGTWLAGLAITSAGFGAAGLLFSSSPSGIHAGG